MDRIKGYEVFTSTGAVVGGSPVPGVGPILGVREFRGVVMAIRNDETNTPIVWIAEGSEHPSDPAQYPIWTRLFPATGRLERLPL